MCIIGHDTVSNFLYNMIALYLMIINTSGSGTLPTMKRFVLFDMYNMQKNWFVEDCMLNGAHKIKVFIYFVQKCNWKKKEENKYFDSI